ncbi:phytoene desaturase family protein [Haloferula rosea]|uniref:Phytoene desaturase n=1 Tax=Haloferula rosea TaxID=490093 RepID=A0A934VDA4_9BACT|nr:phytoene desaturase family protein [Haloferula rosea]MBK1826084.1 phytoene desaturase [Haloferula rosea]
MDTSKGKVVVVGSGLGGLSAAISLRAEGYEVEILEKNERIGGKLNVREMEGFSFDLGPSIFTLPQIFRDLFERAGKRMEDYLELQPVTPHWRNVFEDGKVIDLYQEPDRMRAELDKLDGDAEDHWKDFQGFLDYARGQYEMVDRGYFAEGLDNTWEMIRFYGFFGLGRGMDWKNTMSGSIEQHFRSEHMRRIFEYFIKYVGSSALDAPGYMNMMPIIQFDYGLWYVRDGMYNLAKGLGKLLDDLGIPVRLDTHVREISKEGSKVTGVVLDGGVRVPADFVVCNMEVIPAYKHLLNESPRFLKKLERFKPACSGLVIHLGTDRVYPELAHHNFFFSKDQKKHFNTVFQKGQLPDDPTIYLVAPTRTDPSKAPEGCDNIKILPHIPPIDPENPLTHEDYLGLRERVLDKLERMGLTDLRKHTVVEDMLTPLDIESMYLSNQGSIYGVVSDWKRNRAFKAPKQSKKYRNLFFTGGSVNPGGGMPMAVLCGQKVSDRLVKYAGSVR